MNKDLLVGEDVALLDEVALHTKASDVAFEELQKLYKQNSTLRIAQEIFYNNQINDIKRIIEFPDAQ